MDASAQQIHDALQAVAQLRQQHAADPLLARAGAAVKRFQARRFQATYSDLLHSSRYKTAAAFFLQELYSDKDYAERDQQFARIASTIAKIFPQPVVNTAAALAEVHALTEKLDARAGGGGRSQFIATFSRSGLRRFCQHARGRRVSQTDQGSRNSLDSLPV
jgi:hypothetical protein